jgi:hypothetical protein
MTITGSTVSGNLARVDGGGALVANTSLTVRHSTITGNRADSDGNATGNGGGVAVGSFFLTSATLNHTIVAGNSRGFAGPFRDDIFRAVSARYCLIGDNTGATITNNGGNQIGTGGSPIDPLLGPLADNGGPTMTHALSAGSPAIDAGDPAARVAVGTVPRCDQRGAPYTRVFDGLGSGTARIDMGAFELQTLPNPFGDYNRNNVVDAADYVLWRKTLGTNVSNYTAADGDGMIDEDDYGVWRSHFGETLGAGSGPDTAVASLSREPQASAYRVAGPQSATGVVVVDASIIARSFVESQDVPRAQLRMEGSRKSGAKSREALTLTLSHRERGIEQWRDRALAAWLASRAADARDIDGEEFRDEHNASANPNADLTENLLDTVFASLAVPGGQCRQRVSL